MSTGGAAGAFFCGTDEGFGTFMNTYLSPNLMGVDFDNEGSQTQADIDSLAMRVKVGLTKWPGMRWSWTVATLGTTSYENLGHAGLIRIHCAEVFVPEQVNTCIWTPQFCN